MAVDFYSIIEVAQLNAIQNALEPSLESFYRSKCREYSQAFHTPLHVVQNELDPTMVLQALYESLYTPDEVDEDLEGILDRLYTIQDPSYQRMSDEDTEAMVDAVMNREIARREKKRQALEKEEQAQKKPEPKTILNKPKSGGMSFGNQNLEN